MYEETDAASPCSVKLTFDTQKQAQTAATVAAHQRDVKLRPYLCLRCGLWHLTSG